MNILLVNPNNRIQSPFSGIEPPLWAGLIAGDYLKQGKTVYILDAEALDMSVESTVREIRLMNPQKVIFVVMGSNPSVSSTPKMVATKKLVDVLIGDYPMYVTGLHPSALPHQTKDELGIEVLRGKVFEGTPDIPFHLLPMDRYRAHVWHCLDGSPRSPYASVYTSLNCPYNCVVEGTSVQISGSDNRQHELNIEDIYNTNKKIKGYRDKVIDVDILYGKEHKVNELIEISLPDGRKLYVTPEHLVFTKRGYVRADSLTEQDEVLTTYTFFKDKTLKICPYCGKEMLMRSKQVYCSISCKAKAQPRDYAKGEKSVTKRPEVREKIRLSKLGDNNPMKRADVVQKMIQTSRANGRYNESSVRLKQLHKDGKVPRSVMSPAARVNISETMKINNPMFNPAIVAKSRAVFKERYNTGIIPKMIRTPEQRLSYSLSKLGDKNPMKNPETAKKHGVKQSIIMKKIWRERYDELVACKPRGMYHSGWRGGRSSYGSRFNNNLKSKVKERDGYICQLCQISEFESLLKYNTKLCVHHIDYSKKNNIITNLLTLCNPCNIKVNYDREYWEVRFASIFNQNTNYEVGNNED